MAGRIAIAVIISYLIGNINPAIVVGRLYGVDIKHEGSGNAGTTNVLRVIGKKAAALTLLIDVVKGVIAVWMGLSLSGTVGGAFCFIAVVAGHVYPALYKFQGGKGVATSFGAALVMNWPSAIGAMIAAGIGAGITRKMSVGSIFAAVSYPVLVFFFYDRGPLSQYMPFAILMVIFLLFTHRSNIKRLISGEEKTMTIGEKSRK